MASKLLFGLCLLLVFLLSGIHATDSGFTPPLPLAGGLCFAERRSRLPPSVSTWYPYCYFYGAWFPEQCDISGNCWCVNARNGQPLSSISHRRGQVHCYNTLTQCDVSKNEQFRHCVSRCDQSCDGGEGSCSQTCVPPPLGYPCDSFTCLSRCACPPGYVRNLADVCVEREDCPVPECVEKTMVFSRCAGCIVTCEDRNNPPPCVASCREQCTCPENTFLHLGRCVPPSQCPQPTTTSTTVATSTTIASTTVQSCPENQVFRECAGCDYRCMDRNDPPACVSNCEPRCTCPFGTYLLGQQCVNAEDCPEQDPLCEETMVFSECATCMRTCDQRGQEITCPRNCTAGCTCPPDTFLHEGRCVTENQCPPPCPPTQVYSECATCELRCEERHILTPCTQQCRQKCTCPAGKFLDGDRCVDIDECPPIGVVSSSTVSTPTQFRTTESTTQDQMQPKTESPATPTTTLIMQTSASIITVSTSASSNVSERTTSKICPENQVFLDCAGCDYRCADISDPPACIAECKPRCSCPFGMYLLGERCVHAEECPEPDERCDDTMVFSTCGTCVPTCGQRDQAIACTAECRVGCTCPPNTFLHEGRCVSENQCPPSCPETQVYSECAGCDTRCEDRNILTVCPLICRQKCTCRDGLFLDGSRCVEEEECPPICNSTLNEVLLDCAPLCDDNCDNPGQPCSQEESCNRRCACIAGQVRNTDGVCVDESECITSRRDFDELTACQKQQQLNLPRLATECDVEGYFKTKQCGIDECYCVDKNSGELMEGTRRSKVNFDLDCSFLGDCPPDMTYSSCSTMCPPTCADPIPRCTRGCAFDCYCPQGTVRLSESNFTCVPIEDCPAPHSCKWMRDTAAPSDIIQCDLVGDFVPLQCNNSEICWCVDSRGKKIPNTFASSELFTDDTICHKARACSEELGMEFSMCAPPCDATCDNLNKPCSLQEVCTSRCGCKLGYVLDEGEERCIPREDCPAQPPPPTCDSDLGEVFDDCAANCDATCADPFLPCSLTKICLPRCSCPAGWLRNEENVCVPSDDCPPPPPPPDSRAISNNSDEDEDESQQPPIPQCDSELGEVFDQCASNCDATCADPFIQCSLTKICLPRCSCPAGWLRNEENVCVPSDDCPPPPPPPDSQSNVPLNNTDTDEDENSSPPAPVCDSDLGEVFDDCASNCDATCADPFLPCSLTKICLPRCSCPAGWLRNDENVCVPSDDCPPPPPSPASRHISLINSTDTDEDETLLPVPQCDSDLGEVFDQCAANCDATCADPLIRCSLTKICLPRCSCPPKWLRNAANVCVPSDDCPPPPPPPAPTVPLNLMDIDDEDEANSSRPLTHCEIARMESLNMELFDAFIPVCDANGLYMSKQCYGFLNHCWCVDKLTGVELEGSRADRFNPDYSVDCDNYIPAPPASPSGGTSGKVLKKPLPSVNLTDAIDSEDILPPLTHCESTRMESSNMELFDAFIPECDENGLYVSKQCYGFINHCWCVDKLTGVELEGSRADRFNPEYSVDCDNYIPVPPAVPNTETSETDQRPPPLPRSHSDADVNSFESCSSILEKKRQAQLQDDFIPDCDENGQYRPLQCYGFVENTCWCVDTITGEEKAGSRGHGFPLNFSINCTTYSAPTIPNSARVAPELPSLQPSPPSPYPDSPPGRSLKTEKSCKEERNESIEAQLQDNFIPDCEDNGQYASRQCYGFLLVCWCVDKKTGVEVPGSRFGQFDEDNEIDCDTYGPPETRDSATSVLSEQTPTSTPETPIGDHLLQALLKLLNLCEMERDEALAAQRQDDFIPDCDDDGLYVSRQCYGFLNVCWCVDKISGKELDGSRAGRFNPDYSIDCDNYTAPSTESEETGPAGGDSSEEGPPPPPPHVASLKSSSDEDATDHSGDTAIN